jgi:hypothetical protein
MTPCSPVEVHRRFEGMYFMLPVDSLLGLLFDTEDGGRTIVRNANKHLSDYMASHVRS